MEKLLVHMVMDMVRVLERCKATPINKSEYLSYFGLYIRYKGNESLYDSNVYEIDRYSICDLNFLKKNDENNGEKNNC